MVLAGSSGCVLCLWFVALGTQMVLAGSSGVEPCVLAPRKQVCVCVCVCVLMCMIRCIGRTDGAGREQWVCFVFVVCSIGHPNGAGRQQWDGAVRAST